MKKLYSLTLLFLGLSGAAMAQCVISSATVTPSGPLSVNANMVASGAVVPVYVWTWGDSQSSTTQSATHTYASAGTYTVIAGYADASNTSCIDTMSVVVVVSAVGITETNTINSISTTPNPFGASTVFEVNLVNSADVEISVYDVTGKKVETVQDGEMNAGKTQVIWTPENLADGVYFVQMVIDGAVTTKRIVHTSGN